MLRALESKGMGIKIGGSLLSILVLADGILFFSDNPSDLAKMASDLSDALAEIGLSINWGKCSWTCNVDGDFIIQPQGILVPYTPACVGFPYLGTLLTLDGRASVTLDHRISAAWRALYSRMDIWNPKSSADSKMKVFKLTTEACAFFGCESWGLTRKERNTLDTTLWHMLRKVLRSGRRPLPDGTVETWPDWWRRTGRDAKQKWLDLGNMPWSSVYASRIWNWFRKIANMPEDDPVRIVAQWRDTEWQCERVRLGDRSLQRPRRGSPFRWDRAVHRFWARGGHYWLGSEGQRPNDGLWEQLSQSFNHFFVTSGC